MRLVSQPEVSDREFRANSKIAIGAKSTACLYLRYLPCVNSREFWFEIPRILRQIGRVSVGISFMGVYPLSQSLSGLTAYR